MEPERQEVPQLPPPRGYVAGAVAVVWEALRRVVGAALPRTADDSAAIRGGGAKGSGSTAPTVFVDRDGRAERRAAPAPGGPAHAHAHAQPPAPAVPPPSPPPHAHARPHGALVDIADGVERALLAPLEGLNKDALAAAQAEMGRGRAAPAPAGGHGGGGLPAGLIAAAGAPQPPAPRHPGA